MISLFLPLRIAKNKIFMPSPLNKNLIVGFCNPLLDITATVSRQFLEKYSLKANDAILATDAHEGLANHLVTNYSVAYSAGGAGQNTMRAAQWLSPSKSTIYIGAVGKDNFGRTLKTAAESDGLTVYYMEVDDAPTGTCAVLLTDHHRSLVASLGAANSYNKSHCSGLLSKGIFDEVSFVYITGYFFTVSFDTIKMMADFCHKTRKTLCLNLSAPFVPEFYKSQLEEIIPYADYIFGNESEALAFAKAFNYGSEDLDEICVKLSNEPKMSDKPRMVVITHGAKPTIVAIEGKLSHHPITPIDPDLIVDTNGAGDCFVGGFLSQLREGKSLESCLAAGHHIAKYILTVSGISFPKEPCALSF